ncbi:MAG: efflux RND transporter permease subunit [Desulfovibrio sp.]|nr:MAG: efflux RND transporter permease subunit [Desulfovibrio sp.]
MNTASFSLRNSHTMVVLLLLLIGAGLVSYMNLGKLEDPTFTIKTAMVYTSYPGASPLEVEQEVTDVIEEAIQSLGQVDEITSTSQEGASFVYVDIKDTFTSQELPQIWDELRRKVSDVQGQLPPGAGPSVVNDDFGDVYGVFFALTGEGYSYAELKDYADELKRELLLCQDVASIDMWGEQQEVVYVEMRRARMAELGISPLLIYQTLEAQNLVEQGGHTNVDGEYMRITPTGEMSSPEEISDLLIGSADQLLRLGDVAEVSMGYVDPPGKLMMFNGKPAIGFGISTLDGGNVVEMGMAIKQRLAELEPNRPVGMELNTIYYQSDVVTKAMNLFMTNLVEAVAIVVVLLMVFMGWRSGLLIGFILIVNILGTLVGMLLMGIDLQKISLGALVLALGMLVDNAIVVVDSFLIRREKGLGKVIAAEGAVKDTQWPLLGATFVAILAFTAIGFAPGSVGEFCRSLFQVMAISLILSWILAVTITPLLCVWVLKVKDSKQGSDPYGSPMYRIYRKFLHGVLRARWLVIAGVVGLLVLAMAGFTKIPQAFFPDSTQELFFVDYWKPQGTHIEETTRDLVEIEETVRSLEGVTDVVAITGQSTLRFMLPYPIEVPNSSFGQLLVRVDDYRRIDGLIEQIEAHMAAHYPDAEPFCSKVATGPSVTLKVEARFRGPDLEVLQDLAGQAETIMRDSGLVRDLRTNWRQQVRVVRPEFSETQARRVGVSRSDVSQALQWNFSGTTVGVFRESDTLLPIISRPPEDERVSVDSLQDVQVWSSLTGQFIPIGQVVTDVSPQWEQPLIPRLDRQRIVEVRANPITGNAEPLRLALLQDIEGIELPVGYSLDWGGEYEESSGAQANIAKIFPICLLGMFVIVVWLFNSVRRSLMIFLTLPLSLIGVTVALLATQLPFGFMCILGFLGLSGMLIKNAIVLIDQIELEKRAGSSAYKAVLDSGVSRVRPVAMAAGTTILGMAPLVVDPLYSGMAATIMGGLFAATFLTLFVIPVLYALFFRIRPDSKEL